eukprot:gb/GECH01013405.1/.p1 GENE.gb/GECH01013405.1/~~gb/GECH01013405.1/.p1  ORF type:complete len:765 (+),score=151.61 gb/GECH01013405.1/:1-2295(+)
MDFSANEDNNGVRWSWNVVPPTRIDASRLVIPFGALYTPLKETRHLQHLPYNPLRCKQCNGVLNPYNHVDYNSKVWTCRFCNVRNMFPAAYAQMTETNRPAELYPEFSTVEYLVGQEVSAPVFVFVVDTCIDDTEMNALRESLLFALNDLPENCRIALITFGRTISVYELSPQIPEYRAFVLNGAKEITPDTVATQLGLRAKVRGQSALQPDAVARFIQPLSECLFLASSIIEDLSPNTWPAAPRCRPLRATGAALSAAVSLMECIHKGAPGRIMLFTGGPCCFGPGRIIGERSAEKPRLHNEIRSGQATYYKKAQQFYAGLSERAARNGHVMDLWAANLDQIGVAEMRTCVSRTGGMAVITESFDNPIFQNTFQRVLERSPTEASADAECLQMGLNGTMTMQTTPDIKVCGILGPAVSTHKKGKCVAETEIGESNTCEWRVPGLDRRSTLGVYLEITGTRAPSPGEYHVVQFMTRYFDTAGKERLRVTTCPLPWAEVSGSGGGGGGGGSGSIEEGFDYEAAGVLVARYAVDKAEQETLFDAMRWVDRALIRLGQRFGQYTKGQPDSLYLPPNFSLYPQFSFHLRRSPFLQVFNSSPDETAFYRTHLFRATTGDSFLMVMPTLHSYDLSGSTPQPAMLDSSAVSTDNILMLDSFFTLVLHHGQNIAAWRDQGYADHPEYAHLKELLAAPKRDAEQVLQTRVPYPKYVVCDQHRSQARFLIARLNPSSTHHDMASYGQGKGEIVYTDDASLQFFIKKLKEAITTE